MWLPRPQLPSILLTSCRWPDLGTNHQIPLEGQLVARKGSVWGLGCGRVCDKQSPYPSTGSNSKWSGHRGSTFRGPAWSPQPEHSSGWTRLPSGSLAILSSAIVLSQRTCLPSNVPPQTWEGGRESPSSHQPGGKIIPKYVDSI